MHALQWFIFICNFQKKKSKLTHAPDYYLERRKKYQQFKLDWIK